MTVRTHAPECVKARALRMTERHEGAGARALPSAPCTCTPVESPGIEQQLAAARAAAEILRMKVAGWGLSAAEMRRRWPLPWDEATDG